MRLLWLIPLLFVLVPSLIDAQEQEPLEKGINYDVIERHQTLQGLETTTRFYTWDRVIDYHQNGKPIYTNYKLTETETYLTFESNAVTATFDKIVCDITLYDRGRLIQNPQPLGHLSHTLKEAVNGTDIWYATSLNQQSCNIVIERFDRSVTITATKSDYDWLAGSGGTYKVIYELSSNHGLEWTHQYTNQDNSKNNHKYGFTDVCEGCPDFEVNGLVLKSGQEFTKSQLDSRPLELHTNKGLVKLDTKDSIHDYLWTVKNDNGKKILDFTNSKGRLGVGETLTVDPTFGYTTGTIYLVDTTDQASTDCGVGVNKAQTTWGIAKSDSDSAGGDCSGSAIRFNTTSIPDGADVTNTQVRMDVNAVTAGQNCDITPVASDPTTATAADLWTDITAENGAGEYVDNNAVCAATGTDTVLDLGTTADSNVESGLVDNRFSFGFFYHTRTRDSTSGHSSDNSAAGLIELEITYSESVTPSAPINLVCTGYPRNIGCTWQAFNATWTDGYVIWNGTSFGNINDFVQIGNITTYNFTNLYSGERKYINITAFSDFTNSTHLGTANVTTDTVPTAPDFEYATPQSSARIKYNWSPGGSDGGDSVKDYGLRCERNHTGGWLNTINNSTIQWNYNYTGLASGDEVTCQARVGNRVGFSDWSGNMTGTTYETTTGTVTFPSSNVGDIINATTTITITGGSPEPINLTIARLQRNGTTVTTNSSLGISLDVDESEIIDPLYYQITNDNLYCYTIEIVASNTTGTVTLESSCVYITREYDPDYFDARVSSQGLVNYTEERSDDGTRSELKVNRQKDGAAFQIECLIRDPDEAFQRTGGTWRNLTSVEYFDFNFTGLEGSKNYYYSCWNDDLLFGGLVSYAPVNATIAGIGALGDALGDFFGVNMFVFFIVLVASLATGRSAPTFLIITAATAGILDLIGAFELGNNIWSMLLIGTAIGVFAGKKFL